MQEIDSIQDGDSKQSLKVLTTPLSSASTSAIEIVGLNKIYRGAGGCIITAVEDLKCTGRADLWLPGSQRGRQNHHDQNPLRPHHAQQRTHVYPWL